MEINRYQLFCNTAVRSSGTYQHAYFNCKPAFVKKHPLNWFSIKITSCEIPYQWTQINSTNSSLGFSYNRNGTVTNGTIALTNGNYNSTNLLVELFTRLSNAIIPAPSWTNNSSYNNNGNTFTFSITGTDSVATTITLKFSTNQFLGGMFGNYTDISFGYSNTNVSQNATSATTINVNPVSSIYIRSSLLKQTGTSSGNNQENMVSGFTADISDILAKIQILTPPFTYVFWINQMNMETRISNPVIDTIDVYLADNSSFNLNITQNWTFGMTIIEYSPQEHPQYDMIAKLSGNLHDMPQTQSENEEEQQKKTERKKFQRENI